MLQPAVDTIMKEQFQHCGKCACESRDCQDVHDQSINQCYLCKRQLLFKRLGR